MKIKVFMLAIAVFLSGCVTQQFRPVESTEVINIPGKSQEVIYSKIRQWFSQHFVSGKSVVDHEDPKTGTIIGNGIANIGETMFGLTHQEIEYNIRIDTKDGKFRTLIKINKHVGVGSNRYYPSSVSKERADRAEKYLKNMISDIKKYVIGDKHKLKPDW